MVVLSLCVHFDSLWGCFECLSQCMNLFVVVLSVFKVIWSLCVVILTLFMVVSSLFLVVFDCYASHCSHSECFVVTLHLTVVILCVSRLIHRFSLNKLTTYHILILGIEVTFTILPVRL